MQDAVTFWLSSGQILTLGSNELVFSPFRGKYASKQEDALKGSFRSEDVTSGGNHISVLRQEKLVWDFIFGTTERGEGREGGHFPS
jgi:hypothetical protein